MSKSSPRTSVNSQNKYAKRKRHSHEECDIIGDLMGNYGKYQFYMTFFLSLFQIPNTFHISSPVYQVSRVLFCFCCCCCCDASHMANFDVWPQFHDVHLFIVLYFLATRTNRPAIRSFGADDPHISVTSIQVCGVITVVRQTIAIFCCTIGQRSPMKH